MMCKKLLKLRNPKGAKKKDNCSQWQRKCDCVLCLSHATNHDDVVHVWRRWQRCRNVSASSTPRAMHDVHHQLNATNDTSSCAARASSTFCSSSFRFSSWTLARHSAGAGSRFQGPQHHGAHTHTRRRCQGSTSATQRTRQRGASHQCPQKHGALRYLGQQDGPQLAR